MKKVYFFGIALTLALTTACSSEDVVLNPGGQDAADDALNTARYTLSTGDQTRVINSGKWSASTNHESHEWMSGFNFSLPADAVDVTRWDVDRTGSVYYVPADYSGTVNFPDNISGDLYVLGEVTALYGNPQHINIYIFDEGTWHGNVPTGTADIWNAGNLIFSSWDLQDARIGNIYNVGNLEFGVDGQDWQTIGNGHKIYSSGGTITLRGGVSVQAELDIDDTITATGKLEFQNSSTPKYVCGIEANELKILDDVVASYVHANTIEFNGATLYMMPTGHVVADEYFYFPNGGSIVAYEESFALVEAPLVKGDQPEHTFVPCFGVDVFVKADNVRCAYSLGGQLEGSVLDILGEEHVWADQYAGAPKCGTPYGAQPADPLTPQPRLELIVSLEGPSHDHNSDKVNGRKLSATSIFYDPATDLFYASYHMRGGNYANDTYDKDDIEGCIETWKLGPVTDESGVTQTRLTLGSWMWTNEFDFNHVIYDNGDIVVVGHKGSAGKDFGAIIGRMPAGEFAFDPDQADSQTSGNNFTYKYVTTEEPLYGPSSVQGKGDIRIDYKNAGDANCVVKYDGKYFVTTHKGYGVLDSNFKRIKDEADQVLFEPTPYSAKYLVNNGADFKVLFLNDEPEGSLTATTQSTASIASFTGDNLVGSAATARQIDGYVQPVDGKNGLALDADGTLYACLGKGGLSINGSRILTFGEDGSEPVNSVAIDGDYLYVAVGGHIRILDKTNDYAEVTNYHLKDVSANFINVVHKDGETYVVAAYGQDGVKAFRFVKE